MVTYAVCMLLVFSNCLQHTGAAKGVAAKGAAAKGVAAKGVAAKGVAAKHGTGNPGAGKLVAGSPGTGLPVTTTPQPKNCIFDWEPQSDTFNPPLILQTISGIPDIVLPELIKGNKKVSVPPHTALTLSCPGGDVIDTNKNQVKFSTSGLTNAASISVECDTQGHFINPDKTKQTEMASIGCSAKIVEWYKDTPSIPCGKNGGNGENAGKIINIGFYTNIGFYSQIEVCFNIDIKRTIWAQHTLRSRNYGAKGNDKGGTWKDDEMFGGVDPATNQKLIDLSYNTVNQRELLKRNSIQNGIHPVGPGVTRPPGVKPELYLAKGHLSPNSDFVTKAERRASHHYLNSVPQWQSENNGNWRNIVELSVQRLAQGVNTDLTIVTGGHGVLKLEDTSNNPMPIHLIEAQGILPNQVPIPEVIWKVVADKTRTAAVAFVIHNNPYLTSHPTKLCPDVCGSFDTNIKWFNKGEKKRDDIHAGYTYCCNVAELAKKIPTIPDKYSGISKLITGVSVHGGIATN